MVKPEISSGEKIIILICQSCQNNLNKKILIEQGIFFRSAAKHAQYGNTSCGVFKRGVQN